MVRPVVSNNSFDNSSEFHVVNTDGDENIANHIEATYRLVLAALMAQRTLW